MSLIACSTAVGVFPTRTQADKAIDSLYDAGFRASEIGVVTRSETQAETTKTIHATETTEDHTAEGAAAGAVAGVGIGGLIGLGVLSGVIPVVGPALLAGTLGIIASNAAAGAAVAGVVGALVGWGVPEEDAKFYEGEVAAGRVIVTVTADDRCDEARAILRRHGATSRDPAFVSTIGD